jgi:hypothetical protein
VAGMEAVTEGTTLVCTWGRPKPIPSQPKAILHIMIEYTNIKYSKNHKIFQIYQKVIVAEARNISNYMRLR